MVRPIRAEKTDTSSYNIIQLGFKQQTSKYRIGFIYLDRFCCYNNTTWIKTSATHLHLTIWVPCLWSWFILRCNALWFTPLYRLVKTKLRFFHGLPCPDWNQQQSHSQDHQKQLNPDVSHGSKNKRSSRCCWLKTKPPALLVVVVWS